MSERVKNWLRETLHADLVVGEKDCVGQRQLYLSGVEGLDVTALSQGLHRRFSAQLRLESRADGRGQRLCVSVPTAPVRLCGPRWWLQFVCVLGALALCLATTGPQFHCLGGSASTAPAPATAAVPTLPLRGPPAAAARPAAPQPPQPQPQQQQQEAATVGVAAAPAPHSTDSSAGGGSWWWWPQSAVERERR